MVQEYCHCLCLRVTADKVAMKVKTFVCRIGNQTHEI